MAKFVNVLEAIFGILFQAAQDDLVELFGNVGDDFARRGGVFRGVGDEEFHGLRIVERRLAREQVVHHCAERVDVAADVGLAFAGGLFGR